MSARSNFPSVILSDDHVRAVTNPPSRRNLGWGRTSRARLGLTVAQVPPIGVGGLYKSDFFSARPLLQFFLACNRRLHVPSLLEVDQPSYVVFVGEPFEDMVPMLA